MRHPHCCLAAAFVLAHAVAASAQIKFGNDFDAALENAKKDKKLVLVHFTQMKSPACIKMIRTVFSDPQIADFAAKKFIAVKASADEAKGAKVFQQYGVRITPTIIVLDPQGIELSHADQMDLQTFSNFLTSAVELKSALDALAKVKKENTAGLAAALRKIGEIEAVAARQVLREHAENDKLPESVRRAALEGLSKQKDSAGDFVPFLGEKSQGLRTMAFNIVKAAGLQAMPALLDGLDGFTPEMRVNCFILASALTMNAKLSKDANFWRTSSSEDRQPVIKAWKDWYEKNKPPEM
jgi:hypothetical protein